MATTAEPVAVAEKKVETPEAPVAEAAVEPVQVEAPSAAPVVEEAEVAPKTDDIEVPAAVPVVDNTPAPVEKKVDFVEVPATESAEKSPETPISKLFADLPAIIKEAEHNEMWGVELSDDSHVPTSIVLEKFLRANLKDVAKAKAQLTEALKWRKKMDPRSLLGETEFDSKKFGGLGYVTVYPKTESHAKEIVTWNIYGSVKDNKETFGNVEEYVAS
jgi:hypothetical protein